MSTYPEHDKLTTIKDERDTVEAFLDWLLDDFAPRDCGDARCVLAVEWPDMPPSRDRLHPIFESRSNLLARYFGIDERALSAEKDAMLEEFRAATGANR